MNSVAFVDGEQITHLHGEENWIEVSGFKADHSFYRKAVLACDGRVWHEVSFEYPTQSQDDMTEFVSRGAKAVQDSENQGCEASASSANSILEAPTNRRQTRAIADRAGVPVVKRLAQVASNP